MDTMDVTLSPASRDPSCTLAPQLLALVLAHLEPAERLGPIARVCSAWRTAAVIATNSISARGRVCWEYGRNKASGLTQDKATALSCWLQAHAAAAALDSLTVTGERQEYLLQLPVQQLASLRSLDLERITVGMQGAAEAQTTPANLPPELSGLTSLRLWYSNVGLSTLPAFTNLQHLALAHSNSSLDMSGLLMLTHLHLSDYCATDAALASVSGLTCLQELEVWGGFYTERGLAALPPTLTNLYVCGNVMLAPGSTPAVAQLTALRQLEVNHLSYGLSTAVLSSLSSLQHLAVACSLLPSAPSAGDLNGGDRDVDLAPLSGLTQLHSLSLPVHFVDEAAYGAGTNAAALTASSQLTCLNMRGLVEQQQYSHMFPAGRQLPRLKELWATMGLLGTAKDASALAKCCPNLEHLDVSKAMPGEPVFEVFRGGDSVQRCSVVSLAPLQFLTCLAINVSGQHLQDPPKCDEVFWRSMAKLTTLRDLYINDLHMEYFGGMVELTSCKRLTHLLFDHPELSPDFELTTPEGQPPDIWRRLPQEALQAALQFYKHNFGYPEGALRSMAWAAAQHSLALDSDMRREVGELRDTGAALERRLQQQDEQLQRQEKQLRQQGERLQRQDKQLQQQQQQQQQQQLLQQQEVADLRATVAALESRQAQDDRQRQEVAGLQATVAAMGAQLQALLLQSSLQQG